ncbi:hypothetical protein GA0070216_101224 [Micromonospora matsumotoense]|uniref:Uncharacterized protein n=1 Tax=Micromonospora matsumotoense TaxID=121616 RepID=A0A1C4U387_9ACTN|nr:hypothetical protein [Micromonospora matsumotoense]SCE66165.1 hypothetical protein GA0070216_101224 [Micromonospora matsumotoense]
METSSDRPRHPPGTGPGRRHAGRQHRTARRSVTVVAPTAEESAPGRRRTTIVVLGVVAATSAAALVAGLPSWSPAPAAPARALTADEAERLAAVRVSTYRDVRAGVRVAVGTGAGRTDLVGWVDWSRPLAYLDVGGPGAGQDRGLVQATPSVLVQRPDPRAIVTPARPPLMPPGDRWRLRNPPPGRGLAGALDVLFALAADRAEPAEPLHAGGGRWLGRDTVGGDPVDVLQAALRPTGPTGRPAGPTTAPTGHPVAGDADPRWWVDRDARLRRWAGRLADGTPITVELDRVDRPTPWPVDALGGRPGLSRALTDEEAARLGRLATRLRAGTGAAVTVTAPLGSAANLRGAGWLSWSAGVAYLSVAELDTLGRRTLLRRDRSGFARTDVPVGPGTTAPAPPVPPPAGTGWRTGSQPADQLDVLVDAAVRAGGQPPGIGAAVRVRGDRQANRAVDVFEVRQQSLRLRYWLDRAGFLRRLELRTPAGLWAQLDLSPGPLPAGIVPPRRKAPSTSRPH